jgi:acyl-CoA-binding protein
MDLEDDFSEAADFIQNHASSTNKDKKSLDDKVLLRLYGLYKVVTIGPCNESQPGILFNE